MWCAWVFLLGLAVGSFLNVLIARLPYEKSIVWPSSRCLACYQPIRLTDNLPVIGYLRLRGRCRSCGAAFSARYLWVELGTAVAFLALFVAEVVLNWPGIAANRLTNPAVELAVPAARFWALFAYHAVLVAALIACAVIDAEHRVIPTLIPYSGLAVGVVGGALMPWPWPNPPVAATVLPTDEPWIFPEYWGKVPVGVQLWPFWGPPPGFAPPGSWQLGLLNSVIGAFAGSLVVRLIKWLFETGFGREALGLGDADLLMMAGAFLGWQVAVLSLFVGAVAGLALKALSVLAGETPGKRAAGPAPPVSLGELRAAADPRELPFGPGLALGVVLTWFGWPWIGPRVQYVFFDLVTFGLSVVILGVGVLAAGLLLRRPDDASAEPAGPRPH